MIKKKVFSDPVFSKTHPYSSGIKQKEKPLKKKGDKNYDEEDERKENGNRIERRFTGGRTVRLRSRRKLGRQRRKDSAYRGSHPGGGSACGNSASERESGD